MNKYIGYSLGLTLIFAVWHVFSLLFTAIPAPLLVLLYIPEFLNDEKFIYHSAITISRSLLGFFLASATGLAAAVLTARKSILYNSFLIPVSMLQSAPPLFWLLPVLLSFGIGFYSPLIITYLVVFPLVYFHCAEGVKALDMEKDSLFILYAPSFKLRFTKWVLPSLFPYLKSIVILGSALSLKSAVIGEWFTSHNGIGRQINEYYYRLQILPFYASVFLFLTISLIYLFAVSSAANQFFRIKKSRIRSNHSPEVSNPKKTHLTTQVAAVEGENLSFSFKKKLIFKNLNISIQPGMPLILQGPSGAGKTTLARVLAGIYKNYSGNIIRPERIAMVFQESVFLDGMDVYGNIELSFLYSRRPRKEQILAEIIKSLGLEDYLNVFPRELSGGYKKILSLAMALASDPQFLIIDEPFTGLDREKKEILINCITDAIRKKHIPALIITHSPEDFSGLVTRTLTLKDESLSQNVQN